MQWIFAEMPRTAVLISQPSSSSGDMVVLPQWHSGKPTPSRYGSMKAPVPAGGTPSRKILMKSGRWWADLVGSRCAMIPSPSGWVPKMKSLACMLVTTQACRFPRIVQFFQCLH